MLLLLWAPLSVDDYHIHKIEYEAPHFLWAFFFEKYNFFSKYFNSMIASPLPSPSLAVQLDEVGQLIGHTPLMPIQRVFNKPGVELYAKLEWRQLGHSVKSRPAFFIIKDAIGKGLLTPEKRLLDASSGNTAIGYATVCARLGIPLTICIPENASPERKQILTALGAELIFTSPMEKTDGAQLVARQMVAEHPDRYFYADQYNNENNWKAHYQTTGLEVFEQTEGRVTHLAVGVGTTGTLMGTGRRLRELNPEIEIISLHPDSALHGLEGWKDMETARVPGIYDAGFADQQFHVSTEESYEWLQKFAREEGVLISPSAAANLAGAIKLAETLDHGVVVTMFPDDASKYMEVIRFLFPV